jgi:hypothetical protein|nr:MAG TPA: hypothetical protein [Caudoviricetes sp.]
MRATELIAVVVTSGFASALLGQIAAAVRALWRAQQGRETEAQIARREAAQWECVARRTRAIALDRGAPLGDLPRGPGESPIGDLADD